MRPAPQSAHEVYVKLQTLAKTLGLNPRTLKRYVAGQPFVRVLGDRWYVGREAFAVWWEAQRPAAVPRGIVTKKASQHALANIKKTRGAR